jgi:hypothetical protein
MASRENKANFLFPEAFPSTTPGAVLGVLGQVLGSNMDIFAAKLFAFGS